MDAVLTSQDGLRITVRLEKITPDRARALLDANTRNRTVKQGSMEKMANEIRQGTWNLNGETIKVASDGSLNDGQHRLLAVIKANTAIETLVVYGVTPQSQDTVDVGAKRTSGDVLGMHGILNATTSSAIIRRAVAYNRNNVAAGNSSLDPTNQQILRFYERQPQEVQAACHVARSAQRALNVSAAVAGAAAFLFAKVDAKLSDRLMLQLATGADMEPDSPVLVLRNALIRDSIQAGGRRADGDVIFAWFIKTWNAVYTARALRQVRWARGIEAFPAIEGYHRPINE